MQIKKIESMLIGLMLACGLFAQARAEDKPDKVDLLARHETLAELQEVKYRTCMGMTGHCPDKCGHSGEFAHFKIVKYLNYEQTGKWGGKKETKMIQISDFNKKPQGDEKINAIIRELKKGDKVYISWDHNYVTGIKGSFPERPITKFEKVP